MEVEKADRNAAPCRPISNSRRPLKFDMLQNRHAHHPQVLSAATTQLIDELLLDECRTRLRMIQYTHALHEFKGRKRVSADAGRYSFWRVVIPQNYACIVRVDPGFHKPSPAQIDVRIQKQPYKPCIERPEYLAPIQRARGPVLVNDIDEIGMVSGFVDAMVADRITHGAHDSWVAWVPARDRRYQRL